MAFEKFEGLTSYMGSVARGVVRTMVRAGQVFTEYTKTALGFAPEASPVGLQQEWGEAVIEGVRAPDFAALPLDAEIPRGMYRERALLQDQPYFYSVHVYGRDLETGRFRAEDMYVESDYAMTKQEAQEAAAGRVGEKGTSPKYRIQTITVLDAYYLD